MFKDLNDISHAFVDYTTLLEDRLEEIKKRVGEAFSPKVDEFAENFDPTKNKKYTQWLVDRYKNGEMPTKKTRQSLDIFSRANSKKHETDINKHTIGSLEDTAHFITTSSKDDEKQPLEQIFEEHGAHGFRIPNKTTSIHFYGNGRKYSTNWCTASDSDGNAFNTYKGSKFTLHLPNDSFLQVNHNHGEMKTPENEEVDLFSDPRYSKHRDVIKKFLTVSRNNELQRESDVSKFLVDRHVGLPRIDLSDPDMIHDHDYSTYSNTRFSDSDIDHFIAHDTGIYFNRHGIYANKHLSEDSYRKLHEHFYSLRKQHNSKLLSNPAFIATNHFHSLLEDVLLNGSHSDRTNFINENLHPENIDSIIHNHRIRMDHEYPGEDINSGLMKLHLTKSLHDSLLQSTNYSNEHVVKMCHYVDGCENISTQYKNDFLADVARTHEIHEKYKDRLIDHIRNRSSINSIFKNNQFSKEQLDRHLDSTSYFNKIHLLGQKNLSPHHRAKIIDENIDDLHIQSFSLKHAEALDVADKKIKNTDDRHRKDQFIDHYMSRPDATDAGVKHLLSEITHPIEYSNIGSKVATGMNKKISMDTLLQTVPGILTTQKVLNHRTDFTRHDLHKFIDRNHQLNMACDADKLLNHPSIGTDHIRKLVKYAIDKKQDWVLDDIAKHNRTPDRIKEKINNGDFNEI